MYVFSSEILFALAASELALAAQPAVPPAAAAAEILVRVDQTAVALSAAQFLRLKLLPRPLFVYLVPEGGDEGV